MRYSLTDMREMCCCGPGARTPLLMVMSHAAIYPLDLSDRGGNLHYSSVDPAKARGAIGADGAAITNLRDLEDFAAFVSLKSIVAVETKDKISFGRFSRLERAFLAP